MLRRLKCLFSGHRDRLMMGLVSDLHYAMFGRNNLDTYVQGSTKHKGWVEIYGWRCEHCKRLRAASEADAANYQEDQAFQLEKPEPAK
jgi:hypothetical protein